MSAQVTEQGVELSPRDAAVEEFQRWSGEVERWQGVRDTAVSALEELEERSGRDLVDGDEGTVERLAAERAALEARAAMAKKAAAEAQSRAAAARRAALLAEASELDEPIAQARAAVEAHQARVARLLKALEDFSGAKYVQRELGDSIARAALNRGESVTLPIPKAAALVDTLARLEVAQELLRAAADGEDLRVAVPRAYEVDPWSGAWFRFEDLPVSLRPGGLAPAPGFRAPADPREALRTAERAVEAAEEAMGEQQRRVDNIITGRASDDPHARRHYRDVDLAAEERRLDELKGRWHTAKAVLLREQQAAGVA